MPGKKKVYEQFDSQIFVQEGIGDIGNIESYYYNWIASQTHDILDGNYSKTLVNKIPAITHLVYFNKKNNPASIKNTSIDKIIKTTNRFNYVDENFKHYFWTNDPSIIDESILNILNFEIRLIKNEFQDHLLWNNLQNTLVRAEKDSALFTKASDIFRLMAVDKYGGLYHDLDYEVFLPVGIYRYFKEFNFFNALENSEGRISIGNAMIAASPQHPIIKTAIELVHRNLNPSQHTYLPEYVTRPKNKFLKVLFETGPVMFTIAYLKANNIEDNLDIILPRSQIYNYEYANYYLDSEKNQCKKEFVSSEYDPYAEENLILGADMFAGEWTENYLTKIHYLN